MKGEIIQPGLSAPNNRQTRRAAAKGGVPEPDVPEEIRRWGQFTGWLRNKYDNPEMVREIIVWLEGEAKCSGAELISKLQDLKLVKTESPK
jgi:hypothetical protein